MTIARHYSHSEVESLFDERFRLPDGFIFGASNSGYQSEGCYNGPGQPLNNWYEYERSGRAERTGEATRFWTDYQRFVELARGIGLNGFRMGVDWSRVQPTTSLTTRTAPQFDRAAIEQ